MKGTTNKDFPLADILDANKIAYSDYIHWATENGGITLSTCRKYIKKIDVERRKFNLHSYIKMHNIDIDLKDYNEWIYKNKFPVNEDTLLLYLVKDWNFNVFGKWYKSCSEACIAHSVSYRSYLNWIRKHNLDATSKTLTRFICIKNDLNSKGKPVANRLRRRLVANI